MIGYVYIYTNIEENLTETFGIKVYSVWQNNSVVIAQISEIFNNFLQQMYILYMYIDPRLFGDRWKTRIS